MYSTFQSHLQNADGKDRSLFYSIVVKTTQITNYFVLTWHKVSAQWMFAIFICYNTWLPSCDGGTLWISASTHIWCLVYPYNLLMTLEPCCIVQIHFLRCPLKPLSLCSSPSPLCLLLLTWQFCSWFHRRHNLLRIPTSLLAQTVKNLPSMQKTRDWSLKMRQIPCCC